MSFERVMRELQIEEEELKKLVSAGEIRAFRDSDQMRFKKEDIDRFASSGKEGDDADVIDLLDGDRELEDLEAGKAASAKSSGDELTEELVFDELDIGDEEEVGMKTEPLSGEDLFESDDLEVVDEEEAVGDVDDELLIDDEEDLLGDDAVEARGRSPIRRSKAAMEEDEVVEGPAMLGVMVISAIILLLGILVVLDIATSEPSPVIGWLVGMFK